MGNFKFVSSATEPLHDEIIYIKYINVRYFVLQYINYLKPNFFVSSLSNETFC